MQVAVGAAEADDEQFGIVLVAEYFEVGHGDGINLGLTLAGHQVVVLGVRADGTRLVVLLEAAQDVLKAFATRHSPVADACFVTHVGRPLTAQFFGNIRRIDGRIVLQVGQLEGSRAVGHKGVGHQDDRRHVLQRHLRSGKGHLEAVGGTCCSHDGHGALAVTAKESLQEVGLFALRRQACCRTATLHVEHDERQLHDNSQVHRLALEADARA